MLTAEEARKKVEEAKRTAEKEKLDKKSAEEKEARENAPARARWIISSGESLIASNSEKGFTTARVMDNYTDLTSSYAASIVRKHFEEAGYKVDILFGTEGDWEWPTTYNYMVVSWE